MPIGCEDIFITDFIRDIFYFTLLIIRSIAISYQLSLHQVSGGGRHTRPEMLSQGISAGGGGGGGGGG